MKKKSSLEYQVTKNVTDIQAKEAEENLKRMKAEQEKRAKLPKTEEERFQLVYPSITDGGDWKVYFDAGHWRLQFKIGEDTFQIHDYWVPYDEGVPTEGYGPTDAHWEKGLYAKDPHGLMFLSLGYVGGISDDQLAYRNETDINKKYFDKAVKEIEERLRDQTQSFILNRDKISYINNLRGRDR